MERHGPFEKAPPQAPPSMALKAGEGGEGSTGPAGAFGDAFLWGLGASGFVERFS